MSEFKGTMGPVTSGDIRVRPSGIVTVYECEFISNGKFAFEASIVQAVVDEQQIEMFSHDCELIAESFNVLHETGMRPRELVERVKMLESENIRLRKVMAHVPPRIAIEAKENAGFGTAIVTDFIVQDETLVEPTEAKLARIVNGIKALRRYILVEGYAKHGDCQKSIGFAYDGSIWGFDANPQYEASEALDKCEQWLHGKLDEVLSIADDLNQPVTKEWLLSIGFSDDGKMCAFEIDDTFFLCWTNTGGKYHVELCAEAKDFATDSYSMQTHFTTRLHVLNLLQAFGHEKEAEVSRKPVGDRFIEGLQEMREMLARFVEQGGNAEIATSLRLNWNPQWGEDPGNPMEDTPQ